MPQLEFNPIDVANVAIHIGNAVRSQKRGHIILNRVQANMREVI